MRGSVRAALTLLVLGLVGCGGDAGSLDAPGLSSFDAALGAIAGARTVTLSAYTLVPRSAIVRALVAAAHRGARVSVALTGEGFDYALEQNRTTEAILRQAGVRVHVTAYPLHMKALVADGRVVLLTDTNFSRDGLFVQVPAATANVVENAIEGRTSYYGALTTEKAMSLRVEAAIIRGTTGPVYLETESLGAANPIYDALQDAIAARRPLRILASAADAATSPIPPTLAPFTHLVSSNEKILVAGDTCWTGSANSSGGLEAQVDYGLRFDDAQICAALARRLARNGAR